MASRALEVDVANLRWTPSGWGTSLCVVRGARGPCALLLGGAWSLPMTRLCESRCRAGVSGTEADWPGCLNWRCDFDRTARVPSEEAGGRVWAGHIWPIAGSTPGRTGLG